MPTPEHHPLPDIAVGRHPDFGLALVTSTNMGPSTGPSQPLCKVRLVLSVKDR